MEAKEKLAGLKKLREKFDDKLIGKLPKPSKRQTDDVKKDFKKGIRCKICGGWHHPDVVHLDYVGHAVATSRLLDADPEWSWEPMALDDNELPKFGDDGGLWIKLTVCGVTRLGYGSAEGKKGGNAIKEAIGDAIRNAGMRFGIALDLWSKEDLHQDDDQGGDGKPPKAEKCCGDFEVEGDKHKDLKAFDKWVLSVTDAVKTELDEIGNSKFRKYVVDTRKLLTHEEAPKTITCPNDKKECTVKECSVAMECNTSCKAYQDAIK